MLLLFYSQASLCRAVLPASALCLAFGFPALGIHCLVGLEFMGLVSGMMLTVLSDMRKRDNERFMHYL